MTWDGDIHRVVRAAAVAELAWLDIHGHPRLSPVTPLWLAGQPALAFTYARAELARAIASAPAVALVFSDTRMTGSGWQPLVLTGRPRLEEDRDGVVFASQLLEQELRKYPPSRVLADSPLLRREHWWYLPRLLPLVDVDAANMVGARRDGAGSVLAVAAGGLAVDTVRTDVGPADAGPSDGGLADEIRLVSLDGRSVPEGPAALLGHDFSVPDLERWTSWLARGEVRHEVMRVDEHPPRTTLEPPLGLWQRFRRQRELEKACRRALTP